MPIDPSTQSIDIRRIFTGLALAAVLLLALWLRGLPLLFVILLVCALGLWEFYSLFWGSSRVPSRICAIVLGWGMISLPGCAAPRMLWCFLARALCWHP